jgi:hypothetical protein
MANYRPQYNQQQKLVRNDIDNPRNPAEQAAYDIRRAKAIHNPPVLPAAPVVPGAPVDPYLAIIDARIQILAAANPPTQGFTETLGPERPNSAAAEITSFWKTEIIKLFDKIIKEVKLIIKSEPNYTDNNPILQNFQGYTNIEIDDIGTIIVPVLDEVRIREIIPDQIQFNDVIRILTARRDQIITVKNNFIIPLFSLFPGPLQGVIGNGLLNLMILNPPDNVVSYPTRIGYNYDTIAYDNIIAIQAYQPIQVTCRYLIDINKLKILNSMMQYPQNSNLENYILITNFLSNAHVNEIWIQILQLLPRPVINPVDIEQLNNAIFHSGYIYFDNKIQFLPLQPAPPALQLPPILGPRPHIINKRNFLALMVLVSRNSKDGYIQTNKARQLYSNLLTLFIITNNVNHISAEITRIFNNFIINSGVINLDYINKILNGDFIYKIYKNNIDESYLFGFGIEENELKGRKQLIKKEKNELKTRNYNARNILTITEITIRIKKWVTQSLYETDIVPLSYILDKYTEEEKKVLIRNNEMCKEISEITSKLGPLPFPNILPVDFFVKENISDESGSNFIETAGPTIVKDSQKDRRRKFFEERGPNIGVRGGNKPTRKYYKNRNGNKNGTRKVI